MDTEGAVRRIVAAIDETANVQDTSRPDELNAEDTDDAVGYSETRTYKFSDDVKGKSIEDLASRLVGSGDNLYVAFNILLPAEFSFPLISVCVAVTVITPLTT